jgi:hypothetical protein
MKRATASGIMRDEVAARLWECNTLGMGCDAIRQCLNGACQGMRGNQQKPARGG